MLLFGAIQLIHGETLQCDYKNWEFTPGGDYYVCDVKSYHANDWNNKIIDRLAGVHNVNKNKHDVEGIIVHHRFTKYIPANLGNVFNEIAVFIVSASQLVEIKAENFNEMQELRLLGLMDNNLKCLPLNAFSALSKLKYLSLSSNQITNIPNGLFTNNVNLRNICLRNNNIKIIGSRVFDGLTKLDNVDLENNICLHKLYDDNSIIILKKLIKRKC